MPPEGQQLSGDERAELHALRDLRARVIGFGGDDFTIASWEAAHRFHKDKPYIGCVFCRDLFAPVELLDAAQRHWESYAHATPEEKLAGLIDAADYWLLVASTQTELANALFKVEIAARQLDDFFDGRAGSGKLNGRKLDSDVADALLSLHDYLNDVTRARGAAVGQQRQKADVLCSCASADDCRVAREPAHRCRVKRRRAFAQGQEQEPTDA